MKQTGHAAHSSCCGHGDCGEDQNLTAPTLVEVVRGGLVEARHRGHAVIVTSHGRALAAWGDPGHVIYPRSAIKPLQALPLVESGALDAFGLGADFLALACASHEAQAHHLTLIAAWLSRLGLGPEDLECGAHAPLDPDAAAALARDAGQPNSTHNNCSGKHLGMLTTARHRGEPTRNYIRFEHPVQQRVMGALEHMVGVNLGAAARGVDGCGVPTFAMPLASLALGVARLADGEALPPARAQAAARVTAAWLRYPELIGGDQAPDTRLMRACAGQVAIKRGAEGVMVALDPERRVAAAIKIEDGAARGRDALMAALLLRPEFGTAFAPATRAALATLAQPVALNCAGREIGLIRSRI